MGNSRPNHACAISSPCQRVAALLGLFALVLLLGHVHPSHDAAHARSGDANGPVVSDDSAHHEHSPHATLESAPCFTCRSHGDDPVAATSGTHVTLADTRDPALHQRTDPVARAPFTGLTTTRAPPIALLG